MNNDSDDNAGNINDLINKLDTNKTITNFTKNLESELEHFAQPKMEENIKKYEEKLLNKKETTPNTIINQQTFIPNIPQKKETLIEYLIKNSKFPIIIAFLFILFAHPKINILIEQYIPYLNGTFANLFLRGFIIGLIVFFIKKPLNL
jgi:hypothetical protein